MTDPPSGRTPRELRTGEPLLFGGRYVAEEELARGGMGIVYAGRDRVLERPIAIKVLDPEPGAAPQRAFLREARAAAALKHPNIVDVYDAGVEGDTPYIVMEYVPGESLREVIAREAPVEPLRAATLAARIADALDYAHRRGVVHCDIKPGNILLPAEDVPKIVDFGIARTAGTTATLTEQVVGTAAYIAPEQVQGERPDGRADVYSLAAVLYEMLTGAPPFADRNLAVLAAQRLTQDPIPPHERVPSVPAALSYVVMRGLARDRDDRYTSAAEFAAALRDVVDGTTRSLTRVIRSPVPAGEVTRTVTWGAVRPAAPPRRRGVWLALASVGAVVAGMMAAVVLLTAGLIDIGSNVVTVPDVTNLSIMDAAPAIHARGLAIEVEWVKGQRPYATVIGQEPVPGVRIRTGGTVKLQVIEPPP